jgi:hypothetical protein
LGNSEPKKVFDGPIEYRDNGRRKVATSLELALKMLVDRAVAGDLSAAVRGQKLKGRMMGLWEKAIKPTLDDYAGEALVCSNSAGKNADNFFYNICTDPKYGFYEFHATTMDNPILPKRARNEGMDFWLQRRAQFQADLIKDNDPLVYAQEYLAEFVDWSGVAFFSREKLLTGSQPLPYPQFCDVVFAVIDTASKTGTDNDATGVTFFAADQHFGGTRAGDADPLPPSNGQDNAFRRVPSNS